MQKQFAFVLMSLLFGLGSSGCGDAQPNPGGGSVGFGLQLGSGASVTSATYTISGPNGFASAGSVPVGDSADVPVVVRRLPVGQGYELALSATASDGVTQCNGLTTFNVTDSNATMTIVVHLDCAVPQGSINLGATINICPVLDGLTASPTSLLVGGVSSLFVTAHDSDNGPAPLTYSWAVNGVKLPHQNATTLSFGCSSAGAVTITASVSDGDPNPTCADSANVTVSCQ